VYSSQVFIEFVFAIFFKPILFAVYYDPSKAGNDVDEKASQAAKPKAKSILAIIDPTTGQNVLENLEMSSRQTSDEVSGMRLNYEDNCIILIGF